MAVVLSTLRGKLDGEGVTIEIQETGWAWYRLLYDWRNPVSHSWIRSEM
jgi:hypothetical protein